MNVQIPPQQTNQTLPPDEKTGIPGLKYILGIGALAAVLGGYYYFTHNGGGDRLRGRSQLVPVKVALVETRDMPVIENTIGTVVANSTVSVTARVQGQLTRAAFKEGQMVKTGDLLFQIDPAPYKAAYDSALGVLMGAKTNADRSANLLKQNAIAPQTNDNAQALYMQAKANAEAARLNMDFTQIRSPVDGKTGPILLQPGNLVSVNGLTAPLVTITQIQPIKVSFSLPQSDLPRIQARAKRGGLTVKVNLHDAGGEDLAAPVDFISNAVTNNSGTIELRATFPNTDAALVPGQLVDVTVALANIRNATVVPRAAVNTGPDNQFVYVVTPDHVVDQRTVKVLFDDGQDMAIQGDVKAGDMVVTDGQLRVLPGGKVAVSRDRTKRAGAGGKAGGRHRRNGGGGAGAQGAGAQQGANAQ